VWGQEDCEIIGDICAAKYLPEVVEVAELCGANMEDPVGQCGCGVWVSSHRLFQAFFSDDPHKNRLGRNGLKCKP
jgi:hypothetical protein